MLQCSSAGSGLQIKCQTDRLAGGGSVLGAVSPQLPGLIDRSNQTTSITTRGLIAESLIKALLGAGVTSLSALCRAGGGRLGRGQGAENQEEGRYVLLGAGTQVLQLVFWADPGISSCSSLRPSRPGTLHCPPRPPLLLRAPGRNPVTPGETFHQGHF